MATVVARHRTRKTGYVSVSPGNGTGLSEVVTEAGAKYLVQSDSIESVTATPDLLSALKPKRRAGRPPRPALTALQLADCFEAEAKRLQGVADILRGKA